MKFCMAAFLTMIKESLLYAISDEDLFNLLISDIVAVLDLKAKNGEAYYMDKHVVSKLMNNNINIPKVIRNSLSKDVTSVDNLEKYFTKVLIHRVIPEKIDAICEGLVEKISGYDKVSNDISLEIKRLYDEKRSARILALVFRLAIALPNKFDKGAEKKKPAAGIDRRHPIKDVKIQDDNNIRCLQAVIEAYRSQTGDVEGDSIEDYPQQYKVHFQRQKEAYFTAEAVRHASRDAFLDEEAPFDELLDESYDGIIETWERAYPNGLERMNSVLAQAVQISMESNLISKETVWVTVRVKKGLCHILVNEGKIVGWLHDANI